MIKLDNIILDCVNKALDGKEEKLGDYVDPTKEEIKALMLELIGKDDTPLSMGMYGGTYIAGDEKSEPKPVKYRNQIRAELRKKVEEL